MRRGRIWCVWIIPDQYIEFSGNMVPNYAPVWPRAHLFSHLFVFFSLQALLPSHSPSVRRFGPRAEQLYRHNANQWVHTLAHRHMADKVQASRPLTQSPPSLPGWSIVRKKSINSPIVLFPSLSFFANNSSNVVSLVPSHFLLQQRGKFISLSSLEIPEASMPPSHLHATARHPVKGYYYHYHPPSIPTSLRQNLDIS